MNNTTRFLDNLMAFRKCENRGKLCDLHKDYNINIAEIFKAKLTVGIKLK